ncbi:MAG: RES family NAD+ phosphorylase [Planctomycetes bacterium]|nr:RES family NAD+ phosphorylase [Planctomycetota bacterium]
MAQTAPPPGLLAALGRRLRTRAWRLVEGQHHIATRRLVDSTAEHEELERLLEASKPPLPPASEGLHYLLRTPFRYPPLRHGSRFGNRLQPGVWYGAEQVATALAEVAFYRLWFLADCGGAVTTTSTEHTLFQVEIDARPGVDLTERRLQRWQSVLADPASWAIGQVTGDRLRSLGVQGCRYRSARRTDGTNVALFSAAAFAVRAPDAASLQTWHCQATAQSVTFTRRSALQNELFEFARTEFQVRGRDVRPTG